MKELECLEALDRLDTELKAIKEAKAKEALEMLGLMGYYKIPTANGSQHLRDFCDREFTTIKNALLKAQEQEKVLEIIKEKYVETYILLKSKNVEQYNFNIRFGKKLTQEEFDTLKRC